MSRTLRNTVANMGGLAATTALGLLFAAVYFRILGSEHYGLVGFCTTLLTVGALFVDMGLGRSVIRELARREHSADLAQEMRDSFFTLQVIHFALALGCGLALYLLSGPIAEHWLKRDAVALGEARQAIVVLGLIVTLQLPREICRAALNGLQRQVVLNGYLTGFAALRGVVTIAALILIAPTATVFLLAQLLVSMLETSTFVVATWRRMPRGSRRTRFEPRVVKETWAFATSDGLAVLLGAGMMMGDRILLSAMLPLDLYGGYMLAVLISDVISRGAGPFTAAYFPHLTDLVARDRRDQLSRDYHKVSQAVSAVLMPMALIMVAFPDAILRLVAGREELAAVIASVLAIRALGNLLSAMQYLPHCLQLATGLAFVALAFNAFSLSVYVTGIVYLTASYGVLVPVTLWLAVNAVTLLPMIVITHRRILKGETWSWIRGTVLVPLLVTAGIVAVSRWIAPAQVSWLVTLPWLLATYVFGCLAVVAVSKDARHSAIDLFSSLRPRYQS